MGGASEHQDTHDLKGMDLVQESLKSAQMGAVVGLVAAVVEGLWVRARPKSLVSHTLIKTTSFAAFGALFQGTSIATAKLREKNDSLNFATGGSVVGATVGFLRGSTRHALGFGVFLGICTYGIAEFERQHLEKVKIPLDERKRTDFFAIPPKDPYAKRIEELKSRE